MLLFDVFVFRYLMGFHLLNRGTGADAIITAKRLAAATPDRLRVNTFTTPFCTHITEFHSASYTWCILNFTTHHIPGVSSLIGCSLDVREAYLYLDSEVRRKSTRIKKLEMGMKAEPCAR